jgi:hypothetical protein
MMMGASFSWIGPRDPRMGIRRSLDRRPFLSR